MRGHNFPSLRPPPLANKVFNRTPLRTPLRGEKRGFGQKRNRPGGLCSLWTFGQKCNSLGDYVVSDFFGLTNGTILAFYRVKSINCVVSVHNFFKISGQSLEMRLNLGV